MPTIKITDHLNATIATVDAGPLSAFTKYLKGDAAQIKTGLDVANVLRKPLSEVPTAPLTTGLSFNAPVDLGGSDTEMSIGAGFQLAVGVASDGRPLFAADAFGQPIPSPAGKSYVSCSFNPSLRVGLAHAESNLSFGFQAGASIELTSCRLFDGDPPLLQAFTGVLAGFIIPGDVEDLRAMPDGAVAAVSGHGTLKFSGSFDLAAAVNPLATPNLPLVSGRLTVKAGASLAVGASFQATGDYQIRVQKTGPDTIRLGLFKKSGSALTVGVSASLGVSVTAGKRDVVKMLVGAISNDPEADVEQLANAQLSEDQIDAFIGAIEASVNRSLTLSLDAAFSSVRKDEAAFSYEIDLTALDDASETAVHRALDGDFSALSAAEAAGMAGIRLLSSRTAELRKRGLRLRINLLGVINVLRVTEFVRSSSVTFEPVTGDLVISDRISSEKILVVTRPFEADGAKLRRAVMESLMVTAVYRAAALVTSEFTCAQSYFEFHQRTNLQTMADNLEAVIAAGLATDAEKAALLGDATAFGASTFLIDTEFDTAAFKAMFLDTAGKPFPAEHYDRIGRDAMIALVKADPGDFRHIPLENDATWSAMRKKGQPAFGEILPPALTSVNRRSLIAADYTVIVWWADAMAEAAKALAEMNKFLATAAGRIDENNEFKKRRKELVDKLGGVVRKNQSQFGDPWGLLVMDAAAGRRAAARAVIVSPQLSLNRKR